MHLFVCLLVCMIVFVCWFVCLYVSVCVICVCLSAFVCLCVCAISVCMTVCVCLHAFVCLFVRRCPPVCQPTSPSNHPIYLSKDYSVPTVGRLGILLFYVRETSYLYKIRVLGVTNGNNGVDFLDELLFLVIFKRHEPFGKASLAGSVLYQNKTNLQ